MESRTTIYSLPPDLLAQVVRWLDDPRDVSDADCAAGLLHVGQPRSPVAEGMRLRASATGRAVRSELPAGETSWLQWLLWVQFAASHGATTASGGFYHSAFVDETGQLLTSGWDGHHHGALGQGGFVNTWGMPLGPGTLLTGSPNGLGVWESVIPRPVGSLAGVRVRSLVSFGGNRTHVSLA